MGQQRLDKCPCFAGAYQNYISWQQKNAQDWDSQVPFQMLVFGERGGIQQQGNRVGDDTSRMGKEQDPRDEVMDTHRGRGELDLGYSMMERKRQKWFLVIIYPSAPFCPSSLTPSFYFYHTYVRCIIRGVSSVSKFVQRFPYCF